jgi:multiple sugar transport system permease protein
MSASSRAQPLARGSRHLARAEARWFYLLVSPWIVGFVLFIAGPTIASVYLSFTHVDPANMPPVWIGLTNYTLMLHDPLVWKSLTVTGEYAALLVPSSIVVSIIFALLLNQKIPLLSVWRLVYYLPAVSPPVAVALMWALVFDPDIGLLNETLYSVFHIVGPKWLLEPPLVLPVFTVMGVWQFGGTLLLYLAAVQHIPTAMYESAKVDGANIFHEIWHITIPLLTPVILFNAIMGIIRTFETFTLAYIVTGGGPQYASYFFALNIYRNMFAYFGNMGYADALSLVLFLISLIVVGLGFRTSRHWVHYEAPTAKD